MKIDNLKEKVLRNKSKCNSRESNENYVNPVCLLFAGYVELWLSAQFALREGNCISYRKRSSRRSSVFVSFLESAKCNFVQKLP